MALSGGLSAAQRFQYFLAAGFNAGEAQVMTAISYLECGNCDMSNVNGTGDVGLAQINRVNWGSSDPRSSVYGDLTDPAVSAKAARAVFVGAGGDAKPTAGYQQWCTYPGGCGGASKTSESTFNALVQKVVADIQSAGGSFNPDPGAIGTIPMPGGPTPAGTPQTPGQADSDPCAGAGANVPFGLGGIAVAFCRLGRMLQFFEQRGTWWAVLFFVAALAAIVAGVALYSKTELMGVADKIAHAA